MDERRFDDALRALGAGTSRRNAVAAAVAAFFGASVGAGAADEQGGPRPMGPCGNGTLKDNRCRKNSTCCTKYCSKGQCRCKPNFMTCSKNEHCCSGKCVEGRCDGGTKPAGSRCEDNFNCDDGLACIKGVCTPSRLAKCTKSNCPGCCAGTVCRVGGTIWRCGKKGERCRSCWFWETCRNGVCKVGGDGGGGGGGGGGTCNANTCSAGCCDESTCMSGTAFNSCGNGGVACIECTSSLAAVCQANACAAGTWTLQTAFGSGGSGNTEFSYPGGAALSPDGLTVWIADTGNNRVSIWTRPDLASTVWSFSTKFGSNPSGGSGDTEFNAPDSVAVAPDTLTAWIADTGNNRVSVWTRPNDTSTAWSFSTKFGSNPGGGSGDTEFNQPKDVKLSADTLTAFIADRSNQRISVWTRPSAASSTWNFQSKYEISVFTDAVAASPDGLTVWAGDTPSGKMFVGTRASASSTTWATQTTYGSSQMPFPTGVAVSADTLTTWISDGSGWNVWTRQTASSTSWSLQASYGGNTLAAGRSAVSTDMQMAVIPKINDNAISVWVQS